VILKPKERGGGEEWGLIQANGKVCSNPEDRGIVSLENIGIRVQEYVMSQSRKPQNLMTGI
jgi:hypothetical protein